MLNLVGEATSVSWSDLTSVFNAITGQFTVASVVGVLAGAMGIAVTFIFLWFGVKKGMSIIGTGINNGHFSTGGGKRRK